MAEQISDLLAKGMYLRGGGVVCHCAAASLVQPVDEPKTRPVAQERRPAISHVYRVTLTVHILNFGVKPLCSQQSGWEKSCVKPHGEPLILSLVETAMPIQILSVFHSNLFGGRRSLSSRPRWCCTLYESSRDYRPALERK